jgi:DNA-binding response OmpR family regulator
VDGVSDTAEVLQAVLEPRGLTVNRVRRLELAAADAGESRPSVLILDAEAFDDANPATRGDWQTVPQVIIGTLRVAEEPSQPFAPRRILRKPFHFAELVQAVESLIGREPHDG